MSCKAEEAGCRSVTRGAGRARAQLKDFGKNLLMGNLNLINVSLPVKMFEPRSYLQKLADAWLYTSWLQARAAAAARGWPASAAGLCQCGRPGQGRHRPAPLLASARCASPHRCSPARLQQERRRPAPWCAEH